jgi:hypothetical protein
MSRDLSANDPRFAGWPESRFMEPTECTSGVVTDRAAATSDPRTIAWSNTPLPSERENTARAYTLSDRTFVLRESELRSMLGIGTFRVVAAGDFARFGYADDAPRMERDIRRLTRQGLVLDKTLPVSGRKTLRVFALTKAGKRVLVGTNRVPDGQAIFCGVVRPREAKHDSELYRLFHSAAARIAAEGGRPLRVVLDYELKRAVNRERARLGDRQNTPQEMARLAAKNGLAVVNGKIPLPDLRIEYQTPELELRRVDLELATRHYRPRGLAEKAKAGFAFYSRGEEAPRLRRILDRQKLAARIFAL